MIIIGPVIIFFAVVWGTRQVVKVRQQYPELRTTTAGNWRPPGWPRDWTWKTTVQFVVGMLILGIIAIGWYLFLG
jgi:hypothetical protein